MQLPALPERVAAVQALLHAVHTLAAAGGPADPSVRVLAPPRVDGGGGGVRAGGWCGLRLLPGEALDRQLPEVLREVVEQVFERPPYQLRWLQDHPHKVGWAKGQRALARYRTWCHCSAACCCA